MRHSRFPHTGASFKESFGERYIEMKFSTKIAALFSMILLVIFVIIGYLGYFSSAGLLEKQIREDLEDHAIHTMDTIDRMLYERYLDMSALASDAIISSRSSTPGQITEKLAHHRSKYRFYSSLSFFDLQRKWIADTTGENIGKQHLFTEYWPDIAAGRDFVMMISESQAIERITLYFASIVKDKKGIPFGVVVSRMPVESVYEITEQTFALGGEHVSRVSLLDKEGLVLYSSRDMTGMLKKKSDDWNFIKQLVSTGKNTGSMRRSYQGDDEITAFARERGYKDFKGNGWILAIGVPAGAALTPVAKQTRIFMIVFLTICLLSLLTVFLFSRTITRPLNELNNAAIEIGKGNLDIAVKGTSGDEIGQLARAFNIMAADLKEDIAKREQTEMALHISEKKTRDITSSLGEGIYVINKQGILTFLNPEAERLLGWTENELTGRNAHDIIHRIRSDGAPVSLDQCPMHAVSRTGIKYASRDEVFTRKDGTTFPVSVICTPIIENNEIMATVIAFRNVTERKKIEAEREGLVVQLQDALDKVKTLRGFIPICASCKKVRDDKGYWTQVEAYVSEHSLAEFSHAICPECAERLYPEHFEKRST